MKTIKVKLPRRLRWLAWRLKMKRRWEHVRFAWRHARRDPVNLWRCYSFCVAFDAEVAQRMEQTFLYGNAYYHGATGELIDYSEIHG